MKAKKKIIDVIIPVYRPGEDFWQLLERLNSQSYPINQIILMNTGEAAWADEIEKKYPKCKIHLLTKEAFDHGGTRHLATTFSNADYLLFMTQDALPADDQLVEKLLESFSQDELIKVAYGRQLPNEQCREIEKYTRKFNYPEVSRVKSKEDIEALGIKPFSS